MVSHNDRIMQLKVCLAHPGGHCEDGTGALANVDCLQAAASHRNHIQHCPGGDESLTTPSVSTHIPRVTDETGLSAPYHLRIGLVCRINTDGLLVSHLRPYRGNSPPWTPNASGNVSSYERFRGGCLPCL